MESTLKDRLFLYYYILLCCSLAIDVKIPENIVPNKFLYNKKVLFYNIFQVNTYFSMTWINF